jgi:F0F1-type ATP synthase delta subunit
MQHRNQTDEVQEAYELMLKARRLQRTMNTLLSNHAYSKKEEDSQVARLKNVNASKDELELVSFIWNERRDLAEKAKEKLEEYRDKKKRIKEGSLKS